MCGQLGRALHREELALLEASGDMASFTLWLGLRLRNCQGRHLPRVPELLVEVAAGELIWMGCWRPAGDDMSPWVPGQGGCSGRLLMLQ